MWGNGPPSSPSPPTDRRGSPSFSNLDGGLSHNGLNNGLNNGPPTPSQTPPLYASDGADNEQHPPEIYGGGGGGGNGNGSSSEYGGREGHYNGYATNDDVDLDDGYIPYTDKDGGDKVHGFSGGRGGGDARGGRDADLRHVPNFGARVDCGIC